MRNTIQVIDKNIPKVTIADLSVGQMFRYPKATSDENIYMKVEGSNEGFGALLLATGIRYNGFNSNAEIEVIDAICISR